MKKLIFIVSSLVCANLYSQGYFLKKGESATQVGLAYQDVGKFSGYDVSGMCSFKGLVDFGISYSSLKYNRQSADSFFINPKAQLKTTTITPSLAYYFVKQDEGRPVSISGSMAYSIATSSSPYLDNNGEDLTGSSLVIGLATMYKHDFNGNLSIQPFTELLYLRNKTVYKTGTGNITTKDSGKNIRVGVRGICKMNQSLVLQIVPALTMAKGPDIYSLHVFISYVI